MKLLLDSNVWRYIADQDSGIALQKCATESEVEIVVAPALVSEARELMDEPVRKSILQLLAMPEWIRLMPEAYLEIEEIKAAVRRLRPDWVISIQIWPRLTN